MKIFWLLTFVAILSALDWSNAARAEISGFEQLADVSVACPSDLAAATPEKIGTFSVCPYRMIRCDLKQKGEDVFSGFVTIDCEKPKDESCPKIDKCAKLVLRPEVAEAVRLNNDPNFAQHEDGVADPLAGERKKVEKTP